MGRAYLTRAINMATIKGLRKKLHFLDELTDEEISVFTKSKRYEEDKWLKYVLDAEIKQRFKEKTTK